MKSQVGALREDNALQVFFAKNVLMSDSLISLYLAAGIRCTPFSLVAVSRTMRSPLLYHFFVDHVWNSFIFSIDYMSMMSCEKISVKSHISNYP